jgi:hypothetical protein
VTWDTQVWFKPISHFDKCSLESHLELQPRIVIRLENALEEGGNTREGNCSDIITYIKSVVNSNKPVKVRVFPPSSKAFSIALIFGFDA